MLNSIQPPMFDDLVKNRNPGESRGPVLLYTLDISGYRLSPA